MVTVAQDPYLVTLIDERDRALALNRELEEAMQAARDVLVCVCGDANERHNAACTTIQRLSGECESLANDNDRLRTLIKDFARHVYHYTELYHASRSCAWVDEGDKLRARADKEAVIQEMEKE